MNDHEIRHEYKINIEGGYVGMVVVEPYTTRDHMHMGRTTVSIGKFGQVPPVNAFGFKSPQEAEDYLRACLDALGQLAARDGDL